jgi:hypothetical protein
VRSLDEFLPVHEFSERHRIEIAASRERIDRAVRAVTPADMPAALTTETRVRVTDPTARWKFARYRRVVRPLRGLTRVLLSRAVKRPAEAV